MKHTTTEGRRLQPLLDRQGSVWRILNLFTGTPKNDRAFWATFNALDVMDRVFLGSFYSLPTELAVFRRICAFWNVPVHNEPKEN